MKYMMQHNTAIPMSIQHKVIHIHLHKMLIGSNSSYYAYASIDYCATRNAFCGTLFSLNCKKKQDKKELKNNRLH